MCLLVSIASDIALPIAYKTFLDALTVGVNKISLPEIYTSIANISIISFISWVSWRVSMGSANVFFSRVMKDLTDSTFSYLQRHSHRFFIDNYAGALGKRVGKFASSFETIANQSLFEIGPTAIKIIVINGILFWKNVTIGSTFLAWTLLFVCFNILFARWKLKYDIARSEMETKVTANLADTISNAINLKLFAATDREISRFKNITGDHERARQKCWWLGWSSESIQGISIRVLDIAVLLIALHYWRMGVITLGDFILLRSYFSDLTNHVRGLGSNIRKTYEALADANETTEFLVLRHEVVDVENAPELSVRKGGVRIENITFSYGGKEVIRDFKLTIKPGEKIGIAGTTGSGKSTILKLLMRLYDLTEGRILIDKQDIAHVTQDSLHHVIAYVPQDPILFHRTLLENIRYGRPSATDKEVIEAARRAHCHEFISSFPHGYNTLVGERGVKLSGGERQRVAIARAFLMNAPILILDEATSSLDSETEAFIQDSLRQLMQGRTVIAVAHRLSTIHEMDRIVVIERGKVKEEGTHVALLKKPNGRYRELWRRQALTAPDSSIADTEI